MHLHKRGGEGFTLRRGRASYFSALLIAILSTSLFAAEVTFPKSKVELIAKNGKRHLVTVEVAKTAQQRSQGLMYREALPEGTGMLFDYGVPRPVSMWMKNTLISLDMLFADADGTIFQIEENTKPNSLERIRPVHPARFVLELPAGEAARNHISPGARLIIEENY